MHFTLQNEALLVTIASWGAELVSLRERETGLEYLWQADPKFWGRHAPILFPIVGRLKDDQMTTDHQTYGMKQHGFARDSEFTCIEQHHERITFKLIANERTRTHFPYHFSLSVTYQLQNHRVHISYQVKNLDTKPIYFSIGSHPGFNCPLLQNSTFEDYFLDWDTAETLNRWYLKDGLLSGDTAPLMNQTQTIKLSRELFQDDALIVKSPKSKQISLSHPQAGKLITLDFPGGYPFLGIWSKPLPGANFICIEPWYGIADSAKAPQDFSQKEGINALPVDETFNCSYSIETHQKG